jgi:D-glycero-D-manno-heptose 1,7-bisphosphate phosphatase
MGIGGALMRRAVFLDRDGVINKAVVREGKPYPPAGAGELEILPRVPEALARIREAGFVSIVVTNQPDVARGTTPRAEVEAINADLAARLAIDEFRVCYHDSSDNCDCRKPKPGMLLQAAREWDLDLAASYIVGDRWRDIEAGQRAGCKTVFVYYGYAEKQPEQYDHRVASLWEAADIICSG